MRIEEVLAGCRALHDLPALIDALGGEPRFTELSPSAWLGLTATQAGIRAAAEIGRFGPLPCIGLLADDPRRATERALRVTANRGAPVLVAALGTSTLDLTLGAGVDPPRLLRIDPDAPDGVALATLKRMRGTGGSGRTSTALRLAEHLASQRVDASFFAAFRAVRDRFAAEGPSGATPADRSAYALLQLTRVLFLYFIQRKGWLDGRDDFLGRAVERELSRGRSVAAHLLRPLFFGLLDRPRTARKASARRLGAVPFLNGGLFEPHPLERRWRFDHSNAAWRSAFDDLFERFHFTLDERGDGTAVAPDMLGRVFEGLMVPDERRATGTFYTPARLVDRIVADAASSLLAERLGQDPDRTARLIDSRDPGAAAILGRCRILDPAAGSGAFLLGALELLVRMHTPQGPVPGLRRDILRRQLYGIDLSSEAIRLAELRLWLAAVQDDPDGRIDEVEPLPNLDASLRQGDALRDPRWLVGLRRTPRASARRLAEARGAFAAVSGPGKREAWRRLRGAERNAAAEALAVATADLEARIGELLDAARSADLFGRRAGLDPAMRTALRSAREDRRRLRDASRRLAREGSLPWFDAQSCFGEVFVEQGGFDMVIGNPPWVRAEQIPPRDRDELSGRYRWWRGEGGRGFAHRPDLAVAFLERSLELCAPGGVVAMLLPAKLATAGYGAALRADLAARATIDRVAELGADGSDAFAAVTYPMVLVARRRAPLPDHQVRLDVEGGPRASQSSWTGAPWVLRAPDAGGVFEALLRRHAPLRETFAIHLGVKCGVNAAYLDPPGDVEEELVRQAIRGRDIAPFVAGPGPRLLWPHGADGRPLSKLPPGALRHLQRSAAALRARADADRGPWWALHRTGPASAPHRVAWADLGRRLSAATLAPPLIPLNSCYLAVTRNEGLARALTAWLNASWVRALARLRADPARGGYHRFNARTVGALPWASAAALDPDLATIHSDDPDARLALDRRVAELLGLDRRDQRALHPLA